MDNITSLGVDQPEHIKKRAIQEGKAAAEREKRMQIRGRTNPFSSR